MSCIICLHNETPIHKCLTEKCNIYFHTNCIKNNKVFCPYCSQKLITKINKLKEKYKKLFLSLLYIFYILTNTSFICLHIKKIYTNPVLFVLLDVFIFLLQLIFFCTLNVKTLKFWICFITNFSLFLILLFILDNIDKNIDRR